MHFVGGGVVWAESSEPNHRFSEWLVQRDMVRERKASSGRTLQELAGGPGKWRVRPAAEGRVVVFEQGPYKRKGNGPAEPAKRLAWLYDGKTLSSVAPNRLDPSLPVWVPDHTAVMLAVRDRALSSGETLKQAVQARVAKIRQAAAAKPCAEAEERPVWVVDPAPEDAVGYLVTYQWSGFACAGQPSALQWIYDGKAVWAYGSGPSLDPKMPRWKAPRPR
jgi:hypothetical protein